MFPQYLLRFIRALRHVHAVSTARLLCFRDPFHIGPDAVLKENLLAFQRISDGAHHDQGLAQKITSFVLHEFVAYDILCAKLFSVRTAPFRQRGRSYSSISSSRHTAEAAMPSPLPVKPRPSSVVAFTLTRAASTPQAAARFSRMAPI